MVPHLHPPGRRVPSVHDGPRARIGIMRQPFAEKLASVRAAFALIWLHTDRFVKVRLFMAVTSLVLASIFTALGPVALKNVVDAIAGGDNGAEVSITVLVILYVL